MLVSKDCTLKKGRGKCYNYPSFSLSVSACWCKEKGSPVGIRPALEKNLFKKYY